MTFLTMHDNLISLTLQTKRNLRSKHSLSVLSHTLLKVKKLTLQHNMFSVQMQLFLFIIVQNNKLFGLVYSLSKLTDLWLSPALKCYEPITVIISIPIHSDVLWLDIHWNAFAESQFSFDFKSFSEILTLKMVKWC